MFGVPPNAFPIGIMYSDILPLVIKTCHSKGLQVGLFECAFGQNATLFEDQVNKKNIEVTKTFLWL